MTCYRLILVFVTMMNEQTQNITLYFSVVKTIERLVMKIFSNLPLSLFSSLKVTYTVYIPTLSYMFITKHVNFMFN